MFPQIMAETIRQIGIFGGSFNPIHYGHIALARQLLNELALSEVWFVVSPLNPFKARATDLLDDGFRLSLVEAALADEKGMCASDCEFRLPKPSYMWNTLQHLSAAHPECRFTLLIGADNWIAFHRWAHWQDILAHYRIAVYPREDCPIRPDSLPPHVHLLESRLYPVSSTEIRQRVRDGLSIHGLVPPQIEQRVEQLYR